MWNAITRRRSGHDEQKAQTQFIELNEHDCQLLVAAGLEIEKGASPRDLYCFQYLPSFYDGTPLQVLRLLEEVRAAGRMVRRAEAAKHKQREVMQQQQQQSKRQRVSGAYAGASSMLSTSATWKAPNGGMEVDVELLEEEEPIEQLAELITVVSKKLAPSPVKGGAAMYDTIATPVKQVAAVKDATPQTVTPVSRRSQRSSMKIDIVSVQEETSSRKRKSESTSGSTSTSPLAALFSPHSSIKTPSPGLKTRRSSVLKQFETPEQPTGNVTPQTVPAPPKRFSVMTTEYTKTTTTASDWEGENEELLSDASLSDGLVDDSPEDDERACCDVKGVVEPIWDALQRTSSRFQNAWEEYAKVTPAPTTKTN